MHRPHPIEHPMYLRDHFAELTRQLKNYASFWRPFPFHEPRPPWTEAHPDLVRQLLALPDADLHRLATIPEELTAFLTPHLPFASDLAQLCQLPQFTQQAVPLISPRLLAGIPGRKWQQIEAFVAALPPAPMPILEWCAGKSHLGFVLQHCSGQPVTALEWNAALVGQANARAQQWRCDLHSHTMNVLTPEVDAFIHPDQRIVALHACGDLHVKLLQLAARKGVQQVQLAPCCYQKTADAQYQPLSQTARQQPLPLSKQELHLAVTETVTAGEYQQRQRLRLQAMRLGFDCLQRDVRGQDEFLPVPSLPGEWARTDFKTFCEHCAQLKSLTLPDQVNWAHYEQRGQQRLREVSALDLVRFLFRRPLEIWLALDRALFLQEQGYQVEIGTFCRRSATPRNILIVAARCKP
ncbi:MAG: methyltransferase [Gammaproteobacteria bacterium]|nr:methyltransferase [Gammaproteobacteria bacterium]